MKFPITREELQTYTYSSIRQQRIEDGINQKISEIIQKICDDFERNLPNNVNEKKFVWYWEKGNGIDKIIQYSSGEYGLSDPSEMKIYTENKKKDFMERLRELFIGCTIIMDPLQTYILIDWF